MLSHAVTPFHVTEELLKQVVKEVLRKFVRGHTINDSLIWQFANDSEARERRPLRHDPLCPDFHLKQCPQYHDPLFPTWDANAISGTPFCAGGGPQALQSLGDFFDNTVFNDAISVGDILALGNCLAEEKPLGSTYKPSFSDYCLSPRKNEVVGDYTFSVEVLSGNPVQKWNQNFPNGIVKSCLTVTRAEDPKKNQKEETRTINVTLIGLQDNRTLHLSGGAREQIEQTKSMSGEIGFSQSCEVRKEIFWKLLCQSSLLEKAGKYMFVHCTAGLGRTGHMIAMFEFVKNYASIFATDDPTIIAQNILDLVKKLRVNRPSLILVNDQLTDAIYNMAILYQYGVEKGYIHFQGPSPSQDTRFIQRMLAPSVSPEEKNVVVTLPPPKKQVANQKEEDAESQKLKKVRPTVLMPGEQVILHGPFNPNVLLPGLSLIDDKTGQNVLEPPALRHFSVM